MLRRSRRASSLDDFAVRQVSPSWVISTVAGSVTPGVSASHGFIDIWDGSGFVAVDSAGNLFLSDSVLIPKIAPDGTVTTIADASVNPC